MSKLEATRNRNDVRDLETVEHHTSRDVAVSAPILVPHSCSLSDRQRPHGYRRNSPEVAGRR
jgi:hypothetical protein